MIGLLPPWIEAAEVGRFGDAAHLFGARIAGPRIELCGQCYRRLRRIFRAVHTAKAAIATPPVMGAATTATAVPAKPARTVAATPPEKATPASTSSAAVPPFAGSIGEQHTSSDSSVRSG